MLSWVLASGMFLEVEIWVSLYGILFNSTWTTMDIKDGAEALSGYNGTWVTGEWSGAGRVNGACGRSGGMDREGGGSGADGNFDLTQELHGKALFYLDNWIIIYAGNLEHIMNQIIAFITLKTMIIYN